MTFNCTGCGGSFDSKHLAATFSYGDPNHFNCGATRDGVHADYNKTLCTGCARVMKSMLLNSDLSEHWENEDLPESFIEEHG